MDEDDDRRHRDHERGRHVNTVREVHATVSAEDDHERERDDGRGGRQALTDREHHHRGHGREEEHARVPGKSPREGLGCAHVRSLSRQEEVPTREAARPRARWNPGLAADPSATSKQQRDESTGNGGHTNSDLLHGNSPLREVLHRGRYRRRGTSAPLRNKAIFVKSKPARGLAVYLSGRRCRGNPPVAAGKQPLACVTQTTSAPDRPGAILARLTWPSGNSRLAAAFTQER